ncbi:hypothetical protein N7467_004159 [Penicillium canescens]|nr:hypothetical protein N7467_004159 [Penicillium canescens]
MPYRLLYIGTIILLDTSTNVNAQGGEYSNTLQAAIYQESNYCILGKQLLYTEDIILLDTGTDINTQNSKYSNTLQTAIYQESSYYILEKYFSLTQVPISTFKVTVTTICWGSINITMPYRLLYTREAVTLYSYSSELVLMSTLRVVDMVILYRLLYTRKTVRSYRYSSKLVLISTPKVVNTAMIYRLLLLYTAKSSEIIQLFLNTGADVNTQDGKYGSSLLASIYKGYIDQVQILLQASANSLNLLYRFPELLFPINKRDKLSQTPIYLAICLGHIDFATNLLYFSANPSLLNGYGRNILN